MNNFPSSKGNPDRRAMKSLRFMPLPCPVPVKRKADLLARSGLSLIVFILLLAVTAATGRNLSEKRSVFTNSAGPLPPRIAATARSLRAEHLSEQQEFEMPLKMRNYPKLIEKLGRGEAISQAEMERDYLPLPSDYETVTRWLHSEGFTVTETYANRLGIFAKGSLAQIQQSFQVQMAEVTVNGRDYRVSRTHPSLPENVARPVLGVNGLQPYRIAHKHLLHPNPKSVLGIRFGDSGNSQRFSPDPSAACVRAATSTTARNSSGVLDTGASTASVSPSSTRCRS